MTLDIGREMATGEQFYLDIPNIITARALMPKQELLTYKYLSRPTYGHRITKTFEIQDYLSLAYVLGVLQGDGCLANRKLPHYIVDLQTKDEDFANTFAKSLSSVLKEEVQVKYFERQTSKNYFRGYEVAKGHKAFYLWCKQFSMVQIVSIIRDFGSGAVAMFLRGFIDSEGSPQKCTVSLRIYNTDIELLKHVQHLLQEYFQITGKILNYPEHTCPFLCIYRAENLRRFMNHIGFSIKRKEDRLKLLTSRKRRPAYGQN